MLAGLPRNYPAGRAVDFKVTTLNIAGEWAYADVTPVDQEGHPLAAHIVAVLHHVRPAGGFDHGWKPLDLSNVWHDPGEGEAHPGFRRRVLKAFPDVPREIFTPL